MSNDLYNIPTIFKSLQNKLDKGEITMREVRVSLHSHGWCNYIPGNEEAQNILDYYNGKITYLDLRP